MSKKVINTKSHKNKYDLDHGNISLDDLSIEELDDVEELYTNEILQIMKDIEKEKAEIEILKRENERLRKLIAESKK